MLKRNRTLKVLNLSENKLDVMCLATIAEALVSVPMSLSSLFVNKVTVEIQFLSGDP